MRKLLGTTAQYAIQYLESLETRKVAPTVVDLAINGLESDRSYS